MPCFKSETTNSFKRNATLHFGPPPECRAPVVVPPAITGTHAAAALSYSQTYEYDGLNRLRSVLDSGVGVVVDQKSQVFVYDRYGNRAFKDLSYNPGGGVVAVADTAAAVEAAFPGNRLNNCCNAAGDMTVINQRTLTYDGEHLVKQVEFSSGAGPVVLKYFYDGEGRRVKSEKWVSGALSTATTFVYDASGQLMAEYTSPTPAGLGRQYLTQDHLSSTRLVTKASGTASDIVYSRHDFLPFGEEIARGAHGYGPSALTVKFTGKERDAETWLDYFGARYMSSAQGRFTSPDQPLVDQFADDPSSWNLYGYVRNNPLRYVDPTGSTCVPDGKGGYKDVEGPGGSCADAYKGDIANPGLTVTDKSPPQPLLLAAAAGARRAEGPVVLAAVATAVVATGGAAGASIGTASGTSLIALGVSSGPAVMPIVVKVVFRAQQLAHALRIEPGHNTPLGTVEEIKAAVNTAVQAGSYSVKSGVVKGTTFIQGVAHEFTRFAKTSGEIVFSNIYRK